jgi:uncharacterized protein YjbJ (UPF0337 family)
MAEMDKAKNAAEQVKGRAKQVAGAATGDDSLEAEGHADETKGSVKQAGEKLKDAVHGN